MSTIYTETVEFNVANQTASAFDDDSCENNAYKCGEVFLWPNQKQLVFVCTFCDENFRDLAAFTAHTYEEFLQHKQPEAYEEDELIEILEQPESECDEDSTASMPPEMNEEALDDGYSDAQELKETALQALPAKTKSDDTNASIKGYECPECGKTFQRKFNLRTHIYTHSKEKPFACDHCPATYASKQNLIVHTRRHLGEKPFACDYCTLRFPSSTELKSHVRSHTGERPHVCCECGSAHTTASQLLAHRRRVHLDQRNYECTCGKSFRTGTHLRKHYQLVHDDLPRDKECTECGATFKTIEALRAHAKIHQDKTYVCNVCGKAFAQHPGLYAHLKSHNKAKDSK